MRTRTQASNPHIPFVEGMGPKDVAVEDRSKSSERSGRPKRGAIHGKRNKITVTGCEPGWHYCWVNEDNVEAFIEDGYEFVVHDVKVGDRAVQTQSQLGSKVSRGMGAGVTAYLMRCTEEIHKEIHDMLNQETDATEQTMAKNSPRGTAELVGEVKIGRGNPESL